MNRRPFYLLLLGIFVLGIAISLLIYPFYKPLSLMFYYNREYGKSLERYQALYDKNDRAISVVGPLIRLNLEYANVEQAITLMEEYVKNNPNSHESWKYLGDIYLSADKPHHYLWTLEKLYELAPSKSLLQEAIDYYNYYGHDDKKILAYETMIKNFRYDTDDCVELAELYLAKGQQEKALGLLEEGLIIHTPKDATETAAGLYVDLMLAKGETNIAFDFANQFLHQNPEAKNVSDIGNIFIAHNKSKELLALLDNLPKTLQSTHELIDIKVEAMYLQHRLGDAYHYLRDLALENKLPPTQLENLFTLGLTEEKNPRQYEQVIKGQSLTSLTQSTLLSLISHAYTERLPLLQQKLKSEISKDMLQDNPVLLYSLLLTTTPKAPTPNDLVFFLRPDLENLSAEEEIDLAVLFDTVGLRSITKDILKKFTSFNQIPLDHITTVANLYNSYGMSKDGLEKINQLKKNLANPSHQLDLAWLLLATGANETQDVKKFINEYGNELDAANLLDIYQTAIFAKANSIALFVAEQLKEREPSKNNLRLYADALVINGQVDEGWKILKQLYDEGHPDQDLQASYIKALAIATSQNKWYADEFKDTLQAALHDPEMSQKTLRDIGYFLVDRHYKEEAEPIFFELAQNRPYNDPDTQTLLEIWGSKPTSEQVAWVVKRAQESQGLDKGGWLTYLNDTKHASLAYAIVSADELQDKTLADAYITTLAKLRKEGELQSVLSTILPNEQDMDRLRKMGRIARGEALDNAGESIYLKILAEHPQDEEALHELGVIYFAKAAFRHARWYLGTYLCLYKGDYIAYYYMAEMFYRDGLYNEAYPYYLGALSEIGIPDKKDLNQQMVQAQIYYHLNFQRIAICLYDRLLQDFPYDHFLRGSYGGMLLDLNMTCRAYDVLFLVPEKPKTDEDPEVEDKEALVFLENTRTLFYMHANCMEEAFLHGLQTIDTYPDKGNTWATQANLEYYVGFWRQAIDTYRDARWIEPDNEDYYRAEKDIYDLHRPYVLADAEYKKTGNLQKERIYRFGAAWNAEMHSQFSFLLEYDNLHVSDFTNPPNGVLEPFVKARRVKGDVTWKYDYYCGIKTFTQIYFGNNVLGFGGRVQDFDLYGTWGAGIEYHKPDWDYAETIVDKGSRDRLYFDRFQRVTELTNWYLLISGNRYWLHHVGNAAESIAWEGALITQLPQYGSLTRTLGENSAITLSYLIDAEYPTWVQRREDPSGTCYNPLGITKREYHTGLITANKLVCRYWNLQAHFGYTFDRLGLSHKASPVYGTYLSWTRKPGLTLLLLYDHFPSVSVVGSDVDRYLLNFTYFY